MTVETECKPEELKPKEESTAKKGMDLGFVWQFGVLAALIALIIVFTILEPRFIASRNIVNILIQSATNAVLAIGLTFVIASGGIDISVGSVLAFTGVIMASLMKNGVPVPVAILLGLGIGALCGLTLGFMVAKMHIPPMIATLGGSSIYRGLALLYTEGKPVIGTPDAFRSFGAGTWLGMPSPWILALISAVIAYFVINNTKFGESVIAIGGNEEAAHLSGLNVARNKMIIYAICGMMGALAGIITTARLGSAEPIAGSGMEMNAIAAVVMGGSSLLGGQGKIVGTIIGSLIIGTLRNGLTILNVPTFTQQVAVGLVVVMAVFFDQLAKRRA